jgi:outer membrane protein
MRPFERASIIMRLLFKTTVAAALALPCSILAQTPEATHLTLDQCIEIGVKNSSLVQKNENNVALNGEQLLQSYAQFFPDLGLRGGVTYSTGTNFYTFSGASVVTQSGYTPNFSIGTTLNIFNGLADYAGLKLALAKRDASRFSLSWARQQVILDIVQSFLQVVLDRELLDIAVRNLAASNERLKLLKGQTEVGSASLADLYRQQAQTSSDELFLSNTRARLNDDTTLLVRKLRVDPQKNYEFEIPKLTSEPSPLNGKTVDDLIKIALDQRSDLKAQNFTVTSTDWGVRRAKSGYWPRLDLSFFRNSTATHLNEQVVNGVNQLPAVQQGIFSQLGNHVTYTVGLNLTWSIFDRYVTRYNVASARTTWENAQIDQKDVELQTVADVKIAASDYQIAQDQLKSAEAGLKAAKEAFQAVSGRFSVGAASFLDVLTSQTALVQAQSNQAQAAINFKLREKALAYATGTLAL